jgi:DNA polymerase III subunit epsilon
MNFTSIDFETANNTKAGICAAGVAVFEDDKLVESPYWLVRPPKGCGWFLEEFTENCHGLTWFDVQHASEFSAIAPVILARLTRADIVIAHNAAFDMRKLRGTLEHFGIECPTFDVLCTLKLSREVWPELPNHDLKALAIHIGHEFRHHHAQADAESAGRVLLAMMKHANAKTPRELLEMTGLVPDHFS